MRSSRGGPPLHRQWIRTVAVRLLLSPRGCSGAGALRGLQNRPWGPDDGSQVGSIPIHPRQICIQHHRLSVVPAPHHSGRQHQRPRHGAIRAHYKSWGVAIAVPIGPNGGAGQFPGEDEIAGRETIAERKGREMGVERLRERFGLATPAAA